MPFRRRPRAKAGPVDSGAPEREATAASAGETAAAENRPSITGTYLTDGRSLFRVQHAITEADGLHLDEPLLELEDCATLELILCSAGALERLGLRPVNPAADPRDEPASQTASELAERLPSRR